MDLLLSTVAVLSLIDHRWAFPIQSDTTQNNNPSGVEKYGSPKGSWMNEPKWLGMRSYCFFLLLIIIPFFVIVIFVDNNTTTQCCRTRGLNRIESNRGLRKYVEPNRWSRIHLLQTLSVLLHLLFSSITLVSGILFNLISYSIRWILRDPGSDRRWVIQQLVTDKTQKRGSIFSKLRWLEFIHQLLVFPASM